jgi:hypothetical protein
MTDRAGRRRASKRELRLWAWVAGGLAFAAPWAALASAPKPAAAAVPAGERRPAVVVRTITRRVIVTHPRSDAPVRYVAAPPDGSSSGGAAAPPPPPPATSTGGS